MMNTPNSRPLSKVSQTVVRWCRSPHMHTKTVTERFRIQVYLARRPIHSDFMWTSDQVSRKARSERSCTRERQSKSQSGVNQCGHVRTSYACMTVRQRRRWRQGQRREREHGHDDEEHRSSRLEGVHPNLSPQCARRYWPGAKEREVHWPGLRLHKHQYPHVLHSLNGIREEPARGQYAGATLLATMHANTVCRFRNDQMTPSLSPNSHSPPRQHRQLMIVQRCSLSLYDKILIMTTAITHDGPPMVFIHYQSGSSNPLNVDSRRRPEPSNQA